MKSASWPEDIKLSIDRDLEADVTRDTEEVAQIDQCQRNHIHERASKKRRQAERDGRASSTQRRGTYNVGKREQMHRHRTSAHRRPAIQSKTEDTTIETQGNVAKMPEVDVTEDRWLCRLVNLRSCLKAIVPMNTASSFEWAVDLVWQLKLEVRNELMNSRMGTYLEM